MPYYSSIPERFWTRVDFTDSCWLWTGASNSDGYGRFAANRRSIYVHRYAYEFCVGPIPGGFTIDHLCRVHLCVRPDHLEAVANRINVLRGEGITARAARQTHCKRGHEFTPENTYVRTMPHARQCRACQREHGRKHARKPAS